MILTIDVVRSLSSAIHRIRLGQYDPHAAHARVQDMYSWGNVAERTEAVYRSILEGPEQRDTFERMIRYALFPCFSSSVAFSSSSVGAWSWSAYIYI
jgi:phosphatidylinositol glycan class A protein